MYRGNFFIEDSVLEEQDFPECTVHQAYQDGRGVVNLTFKGNAGTVACDLSEVEGRLQIHVSTLPKPYNRLIIRLVAREDEHVWGCGEQFSHFDLRGKHFPRWT